MNTNLKIIVLNHLNSSQKATIKISNSSQSNVELKLPFVPNGEHILLLKTNDNIYKKTLPNTMTFTYALPKIIDLDKKIAVLIVNQNEFEQKPVFWGGTNCISSVECQSEIDLNNDKNNIGHLETENNREYDKNKSINFNKNNFDDLEIENNKEFINKNLEIENNKEFIENNKESNNEIINVPEFKENVSNAEEIKSENKEYINQFHTNKESKIKNTNKFNLDNIDEEINPEPQNPHMNNLNLNDNFSFDNKTEKTNISEESQIISKKTNDNLNLSNEEINDKINQTIHNEESRISKMNNQKLSEDLDFQNKSDENNQSSFYLINGRKKNYTHLFDYTEEELERTIDKCLNNEIDAPCGACKYKQDFYQQDKMEEARKALEDISKMQNKGEVSPPQYYSLIEGQYNEMFERYPIYTELGNIIPNSKWLKVEMDSESYVLGLIYESGEVKYMCYGVPQTTRQTPPPELAEISQWLPLDLDNPNGAGLWIMYQSAETGETIKVDII